MTGRVNILWRVFEKIANKLKIKSQERFWFIYLKTLKKYFFGSCDFNFELFCSYLKNAPDYITPSGNLSFMKFFVALTSRTRFFFNWWKVKYLRHLWINHPNLFSESTCEIYRQVLEKLKSYPTIRRTSRTTSKWIPTKNVETKLKFDMDSFSLFIN